MIDEETLRLRRGLGTIFVTASALHLAVMALASLYIGGSLPGVRISAARWSQMFFAAFLFAAVTPVAYLARAFWRGGRFLPQAMVDFLTGLLIYLIFFALAFIALSSFALSPWFSLAPGVFLLYYGLRIRHGRQIWALLDI